jgi:hypothetical protein
MEEAPQRQRRRRAWSIVAVILIVGGIVLGLVIAGGSDRDGTRTISGNEGGNSPVASTRGSSRPSVVVTSVTAILAPYDPAIASGGVPEENVSLTVYDPPTLGFFCDIQVRNAGKLVGALQEGVGDLTGHPSSLQESVGVQVTGSTFDANPADATVSCSPARAVLSVVVNSVIGHPTTKQSGGASFEWIAFTVRKPPAAGFVCNIKVRQSGELVGGGAVSIGAQGVDSSSGRESVPVSVAGPAFDGSPQDATVSCSPAFRSTPG